jgi:hypothetical protein
MRYTPNREPETGRQLGAAPKHIWLIRGPWHVLRPQHPSTWPHSERTLMLLRVIRAAGKIPSRQGLKPTRVRRARIR